MALTGRPTPLAVTAGVLAKAVPHVLGSDERSIDKNGHLGQNALTQSHVVGEDSAESEAAEDRCQESRRRHRGRRTRRLRKSAGGTNSARRHDLA